MAKKTGYEIQQAALKAVKTDFKRAAAAKRRKQNGPKKMEQHLIKFLKDRIKQKMKR